MTNVSVETRLDKAIQTAEVDAFLQYKDGSDINHQYLTGFKASDPFTYLRYNNQSILLVAPVEKAKAETQSTADEVRSTAEFVSGDVRDDIEAEASIISDFVSEYEITDLGVPRDFDLYLAEILQADRFTVRSIEDIVMEARKQKSGSELEKLRTVQSATEQSMRQAKKILHESTVVEGELRYNGDPLTSERLRNELRNFLMDKGCDLDEAIVACGTQSADPHDRGSGTLSPNEPILLDIFPQHNSGYWGDMSRTFVKGTPAKEFQKMYDTTIEAFEAATDVLSNGAGITGHAVHTAVCDVFESAGYSTIREGDVDEGLLHSTGHAIGLELHEPPRLVDEAEELKEGYVLTVEPGLYKKDYGGIRIEDMIVITEDGYENLNNFTTDYQV